VNWPRGFENQPESVIREAQSREVEEQKPEQKRQRIESALTYSREKNVKSQAVVDERDLKRDSLRRSMGYASFAEVKDGFENRISSRDLVERENRSPGRAFTTDEMIAYERDTIAVMQAGQNQYEPLVSSAMWREVERKHSHLKSKYFPTRTKSQPSRAAQQAPARLLPWPRSARPLSERDMKCEVSHQLRARLTD
jgi:hypothetical protein